MLHPINFSLSMLIFLSKFWRCHNILSKIFNNLPFPCQDLQGSLTFLSRSFRIFKSFAQIFNLLVKIFKEPTFSWQDLQRSFNFLPRSLRVFYFLSKIFNFLAKIQDLGRKVKDPWRSWQKMRDPQRS